MNELIWIVQVISIVVLFSVNRRVLSRIAASRAFGDFVMSAIFETHPEARQTFAAAQNEAIEKFPF